MQISKDTVVTIEFTLTDDEGVILDSTDDREAHAFLHGRGDIFEGLEEALLGHHLGEKLKITLPPEQGFGPSQDELIKQVSMEYFKKAKEITLGMQFKTDKEGEEVVVTVVDVDKEKGLVTIDANHPLAKSSLHFDLVIVGVRKAVAAELRTGQIQTMDEVYSREGEDV
ncbi:MAG: FKBP-type peptidyl-prolyl cis-trans isomerase [Candidatus Polarisedimenticolaceae bacterium]|nr:FKBP-type peptidyl-prolyl cis-trans isomerase [Candidatus Polarisedimenticolaceae bacterium]